MVLDRAMVFGIIGGLGLFIFGMRIMGEGLQRAAGDRMRKILEALTTNPFMGVIMGTFVTALVQSSSATTVMVVGFVNAGLMSLHQAAGVIMGANIGTTFTAQLIAFKLTDYALPSLGTGVGIYLFAKRKSTKNLGYALAGFGMLFLGMGIMTSALKPLGSMPAFTHLTAELATHPILGVLVGVAFTSLIQSSSATIGILQGLAAGGVVSLNAALPVLFGDNIGTCVTALLASIGASVTARRAAGIHLLFNLIGTMIFLILLPIVAPLVRLTSADPVRQIANAHTLFNVSNTLFQLPFIALLVAAVTKLVPGSDPMVERGVKYLDKRLLETPTIALAQVEKEVLRMGLLAKETLHDAFTGFLRCDDRAIASAYAKEEVVNELERETVIYLVSLSQKPLSEKESARLNLIYNVINDAERVGDHAENIAELGEYRMEHNLPFSPEATAGLTRMYTKVTETLNSALEAFRTGNQTLAEQAIREEDIIDAMEKEMRRAHIRRLNEGRCFPGSGVVFLDVISNLERIGDHASSIAHGVLGDT